MQKLSPNHTKQHVKLNILHKIMVIVFLLPVNYAYTQTTYYSRNNGDWTNSNTWSTTACGGAAAATAPGAGDNVIVCDGNTVSLDRSSTINDVSVNPSGLLNIGNKIITLNGDLVIDGSILGQNGTFVMNNSSDISGVGTIKSNNNACFSVNADITISSLGLSIFSDINSNIIDIDDDVTVTNNGHVIVKGNIVGRNTASTWINAENSSLIISCAMLSTGTLKASASGNTIEYSGSVSDQDIKIPDSSYHNLIISGTTIKTQQANLTVDGDFTINSGTYDCNFFDLNIKGNWTNRTTFIYEDRTVTFDGTSDQTVTSIDGETFYNLTVNKSSGTLLLNDNVTVIETLTMTQGNINSEDDKITVGESETDYGTLAYTSGQVIGKYEKWLTSTNHGGVKQFFPVGTDAYCRPAEPTFTIGGGAAGGGTVIAEFVASNPGNDGLTLQDPPQTAPDSVFNAFNEGYWTLTPANGISISGYDLELTGNGFSSFPIDTETRLLTRAGSGSNWTNEGTHVNAVNPTAKRTGLTTFLAHYCFGDDTPCSGPVTSSITGSASVCTDDVNVVYSVTNTPGSTYTWTITGGTIASGQGTSSIEVNWGSVGMVGDVEVVEHNGCTYGDPVNLTVVIHTIQPSSISGTTFVPVEQTGVSYSINDTAGYSYTWTITGGTLTSGQGTSSITVDWNSTAGWGEVKVVASGPCGDAAAKDLDVWIYIVIESITTGNWDDVNTWDCHCVPLETDNVRINNGHTVSVNVSNATVKSLSITAAGVLAAGNKEFTTTGHVTIDGSFTGTNILTLSGNNTTISGMGTIENTKELSITGGNKTIASNSMLTKTADNVTIGSDIFVTNNGSFSIQSGNLTINSGSSWENAEYSTLKLGGEISLSTGTLYATATDNVVNYYRDGDQDIRDTAYYHLIASGGSGIKTLYGDVTVNGDFTIGSGATCDASANNYDMDIRGDWTNNGTFTYRLGTVTFDGSSTQTIGGTTATTFYDIVFNNTTGSNADILLEDNNPTVSDSSTFTNGIVNTGANKFIFGASATTNEGTITSFIDGLAEKTSATSEFTFPTGDVNSRDLGYGLNTYK
ncbi:MAG: hypothetical protein PF590_01665, partial [Candidatus Delongbacteria bacterium]|nr:hypothetical protein [Candidatus Delongbacteria bacterium]